MSTDGSHSITVNIRGVFSRFREVFKPGLIWAWCYLPRFIWRCRRSIPKRSMTISAQPWQKLLDAFVVIRTWFRKWNICSQRWMTRVAFLCHHVRRGSHQSMFEFMRICTRIIRLGICSSWGGYLYAICLTADCACFLNLFGYTRPYEFFTRDISAQ